MPVRPALRRPSAPNDEVLAPPARLPAARRAGFASRLSMLGSGVARVGLALPLALIGGLKFTAAEAKGIAPLVASSPLLAWTYALWSPTTVSAGIGAVEIVAALCLLLRPVSARAGALGSALATATFATTVSFLLSAPGVWDARLGFPALGGAGQFLIKDVALLGASLWALGDDLQAWRVGSSLVARA